MLWRSYGKWLVHTFSKPKFSIKKCIIGLLPSYVYEQYFMWIFFRVKENELLLQNSYMSIEIFVWFSINYCCKCFVVFFVTIWMLQQDIFVIIFSLWWVCVHAYIAINSHRMVHSDELPNGMVVTAKCFHPIIANFACVLCSRNFTSVVSAPPDILIEALV